MDNNLKLKLAIEEDYGILKLVKKVAKLEKRVKRLEEKDSYYPNKEEIRNIKIGLNG